MRLLVKFYFILWLTTGCLTPTDLDVELKDNIPTVNGQISTLAGRTYVQLGVTSSQNSRPAPISYATVEVVNDLGERFPLWESAPGTYINEYLVALPGRKYQILVNTFGGDSFTSAMEETPPPPGSVEATYRFALEEYTDGEGAVRSGYFVKVGVNSVFPSSTKFLRWEVEEVFQLSPTDYPDPFGSIPEPCYITRNADPQRIALLNRNEVNLDTLESMLVGSRLIDWTFKERHYLTTYETSLTAASYEYWRRVGQLSGQVGSIFDAPPSEITTNISWADQPERKVYGYFQVASETYSRFFLTPFDLPVTLPRHCEFDPSESYPVYIPYECQDDNCQKLPGSSVFPPPWF